MNKKIKIIKMNKTKNRIVFDDDSDLVLNSETFADEYLFVGKELTDYDIKMLAFKNAYWDAVVMCKKWLARRNFTKNEIKSKLNEKHYAKAVINDVIDYLMSYKLINDKEYLLDLVSSYNSKNFGENKIISKLYEKGFNKEDIDQINFDYDLEFKKASINVEKYLKSLKTVDMKLKINVYRHLQSQGFTNDVANGVVLKLIEK